jgi:multidrug efflux pump subunit AcrA (membrane-fusion protein)
VRLSFAAPTTLSVGTGLRVRILAVEKHGVLIVPTAALTHNDDGEKVVMVVDKDNKVHEQPIQTGLATHDFTEITSGIKAGDQVVVRGLQGLPDGALVSIIK